MWLIIDSFSANNTCNALICIYHAYFWWLWMVLHLTLTTADKKSHFSVGVSTCRGKINGNFHMVWNMPLWTNVFHFLSEIQCWSISWKSFAEHCFVPNYPSYILKQFCCDFTEQSSFLWRKYLRHRAHQTTCRRRQRRVLEEKWTPHTSVYQMSI